MDFKVLKLTENSNLILEKCEKAVFKTENEAIKKNAIENMQLYFKGEKAAKILEPIGSVSNPLYVASSDAKDGGKFVGLILSSDLNKR